MKISILCPNLSGNCLGRAYLLAKILQRKYEVEIVGCAFKGRIWPPLANSKDVELKYINIRQIPVSYWQLIKLFKQKIDGDIIYVSKPMLVSFGVGLFRKWLGKKPLVLDIDDWEMGFVKEKYRRNSVAHNLFSLIRSGIYFYEPYSIWSAWACEKAVGLADAVTVSGTFLKQKFGGTIIAHARDTELLDPALHNKNSARQKYNIPENKKVIMFFGTPTPYKGIEDLVKAVGLIDNDDLILVVVGIDITKEYCRTLVESAKQTLGTDRFIGLNFQPFGAIPEILSMADIMAIPQRKSKASQGQLPAKVFDAMAMAKPIIATNVADLPQILDGCGWVVEPEDPKALAETISYILENPSEAKQAGQEARKKCIENYSYNALAETLSQIFENIKKA